MATQVNGRAGAWLDGVAVAAQDMRLQVGSALLTSASAAASTGIATAQGVRPGQGNPLLSTWTSGMAFTLNAGTCWVQGTASANAGMYTATLDTTATLTVPNGDPTNPRIDSVIAVISDVGTSSSTTIFKILPGTPAGSPVHTALPANALRLCDIAVAANASVLSAPNFTDLRANTVAVGGILPVASSAGTQNGPAGTYLDDLATGRLKRLDGAGNAKPPKVGGFAPQVNTQFGVPSAAIGTTTAYQSLISVTVDGATEVAVLLRAQRVYQPTSPTIGDQLQVSAIMDGSAISEGNSFVATFGQTTTNANHGTPLYWQVFVTPSAGTHTFGYSFTATGTSAWGLSFMSVRVMPAVS